MTGPGEGGGGGGECPRPISLKLLKIKFGGVVKNHKLLNLV